MLTSMEVLLKHAKLNKYIVAAPNVWNEWSTRAAIDAAIELKSPLILDMDYNSNINLWMSYAKLWSDSASTPIAINLDHGQTFEQVIKAIQSGFTSVMLDKSHSCFEENIREVKRVSEIASICGVSVEAELGFVGDAAIMDQEQESFYTDPALVSEFIERTMVDCLAVSVGTAHGKYKEGIVPKINFELIKKIEGETELPLVLHGGSGTPENILRKLAKDTNISKINIFTDIHEHVINNTKQLIGKIPLYELDKHFYKSYKDKLKEFIVILGSSYEADNIITPRVKYYEANVGVR